MGFELILRKPVAVINDSSALAIDAAGLRCDAVKFAHPDTGMVAA